MPSDENTQYLTFTLDQEQYAVDVVKVREVLEVPRLTRIPSMPVFMHGVINIRGSVVPVICLRSKFGMAQTERTVDTSIIVMDIERPDETLTVGCLADSVQEVIEIEPAPRLGTKVETTFISGIGKIGDEFVIILDIDSVFRTEGLAVVGDHGN